MLAKVGLIAMTVLLMALCYEIGYCKGYEQGKDESEKIVKGNQHGEKSD